MTTLSSREAQLLGGAIARMRAGIMAIVFGMVGGAGLALATVWLLVRGGRDVGQHLNLLGHYFPGYAVTWPGALMGLVYGAAVGALTGYALAWIYNRVAARRQMR
ncbi:MAG: hypothetical protein ABR559_09650 [Gemmatimonadota bacterium]